MSATTITRHVRAPRGAGYRALVDSAAVARWRPPVGMTALVHQLARRQGGSFRVSLTYDAQTGAGKTSARTDTYHGRFARLVPNEQVVEVLQFETARPDLGGEIRVTTTLMDADNGTGVLVDYEGLPRGVSAADHESGARMSLDNLAALVESGWQSGPHG